MESMGLDTEISGNSGVTCPVGFVAIWVVTDDVDGTPIDGNLPSARGNHIDGMGGMVMSAPNVEKAIHALGTRGHEGMRHRSFGNIHDPHVSHLLAEMSGDVALLVIRMDGIPIAKGPDVMKGYDSTMVKKMGTLATVG